jgi:hypothetical protein
MSPLHRRNHNVDKIILESEELRAQLVATVEELERFVAAFSKEFEEQGRCPGEDDESERG